MTICLKLTTFLYVQLSPMLCPKLTEGGLSGRARNRGGCAMTQGVDRRAFIAGLAAGAAVMAFDPVRHSWMTAAQAAPHGGLRIPRLDGELVIEPVALEEAADDFGHIIYRTPTAVLRPGSPQDVVKLVRYANRHGLQVAMRGQGHATFGQAQAQGGVVIDSRTLNTIHSIGTSGAVVDAGVQWIALLQASLAMGLTPPVLTDYLGLSVGGTLSVGGIGSASHRYGLQIDNVLELQVVTGQGQLLTCSPSERPGLFHAVLGGLGQCALIVRATITLVPARERACVSALVSGSRRVHERPAAGGAGGAGGRRYSERGGSRRDRVGQSRAWVAHPQTTVVRA
jgi:cytokinin dehydrogenase